MGYSTTSLAALVLVMATGGVHAEVLRFGYAQNAAPTVEAMQKFGELVAEKTNGDVTVQFFPDGQLGGEREMVELLQGGALDMTKVSAGLMESFSPIYGIFAMPYLFTGQDHFYAALDDAAIMQPIYESSRGSGVVGLTYYNSGARSFYTTKVPVKELADLKGLKIRVLESPTAIRMTELLGATPVAMGQAEVYTSLQQGILDGAENNESALTIARHGEVAKYYSYDEHTRIPDILLIGTATLDRLSEDQRTAVAEAAKESTEFHKSLWDASIAEEKKQATDLGVTFFDVDVEPFREAVAPMYNGIEGDKKAAIDAIRNIDGGE